MSSWKYKPVFLLFLILGTHSQALAMWPRRSINTVSIKRLVTHFLPQANELPFRFYSQTGKSCSLYHSSPVHIYRTKTTAAAQKSFSTQNKGVPKMRVNHLIIGTGDVEASTKFYNELFGFETESSFIDTGTKREGRVLTLKDHDQTCLQVLLVPFTLERLPNPQHLAFEVDAAHFDSTYKNALSLGLKVRSKPPLDSLEEGIGELDSGGHQYKNFYILDPAGVNLEIMTKL